MIDDAAHDEGANEELREAWDVRDGIECTHSPRIRFKTLSGREVTFDSALSSLPSAWRIGSTVRVRYQPDQPQAAEIDSLVAMWLAPGVLGLLAVAFWFVGVGAVAGVVPL